MDQYQLLIAEPKLARVEQLIYTLICNLHGAQLSHQFDDANAPAPPSTWKFLFRPRAATEQWLDALDKCHLKHGFPEPRDPLPLAKLWPTIDPPRDLNPCRVEPHDLYFDRFVVSQRFADSKRWYIVAAPISDDPFRCLVHEFSTGRCFCSSHVRANCGPPATDDFALLQVHTKPVDRGTRRECAKTIPRKIDIYLPGCYAPWKVMNVKGEEFEELITGI